MSTYWICMADGRIIDKAPASMFMPLQLFYWYESENLDLLKALSKDIITKRLKAANKQKEELEAQLRD